MRYVLLLFLWISAGSLYGTTGAEELGEMRSLFERAKEAQGKKDYPAAIDAYGRLVALTPPAGQDSAAYEWLADGLLQLMYCYVFDGRREDGAIYFTRMYEANDCWIVRHSPRDIEICTAYALYEAAQPDRAAALIDHTWTRPNGGRSPERLYVDYGISSVIYNQIGEVRKAIDCNEHSLALLKGLPDKSKMAFVLGNLIYQYQQVGEFERALAAYDSLIVSGQGEVNPYGLCAAEVNAVHLFDEWGMEDEVFNHLEKAREAATRSAIPDAFLRVDNLATYYALLRKDYAAAGRLLDSVATRLPDRSQVSFYHRFYDHYRTVLAIGTAPEGDRRYLAAARQAIDTLAARPLDNLSVLACRLLGNALADRGEDALAIRAYQTCADYIGRHGLLNQQREIYYALATLYTRVGRQAEAGRFYQLAKRANDRFTERRNAGLVSQFSVKYQTLEKERENLLLEKELLIKQRTIRYYVLIILALVLLGGLFVVWLLMRHRVLLLQHELDQLRQREDSRRLEEKEQQLQAVSDSRSRLDQAYQELRMELVHKDVDAARQEAINRFSPRLLTQEEERKFRQQFGQLHPAFLVRLREACPGVTNSEELHAMLIRLRLNVDEIAFTLGINRSSVHTARSRLRKKLGIPKTSSLEDFLMKL